MTRDKLMKCPNCGHEIRGPWANCPRCGAVFARLGPEEGPENEKKPKNGGGPGLPEFLPLLAAALAVIAWLLLR